MDYFKETWFLGFKSGHITYQLAVIFFSVMYVFLFNKKMRFIPFLGLAAAILSNVLVKNTTATVILIPLAVVITIPPIIRFTKVFNILTYTGIGVFIQLLVMVFRGQDTFKWFITGVLHKSTDLTKRTAIWDMALGRIKEHPVIGHG